MDTDVLDVDTARRRIVDLTGALRAFCGTRRDGLCNVFVPHATAGVAIIETGAGSDDDLIDTLGGYFPATAAIGTRMARRGTEPTTFCPHSCRRR